MSTIRKFRVVLTVLVTALALLTVGAPAASADSISFTLTQPNSGLSGTYPPGTVFATVGLSLSGDGTTITVTVTTADSFKMFDNGAGSAMFGININQAGLTIGGFSGASLTSGNTMDGFGSFGLEFNNCCTPPNGLTSFSFTITKTGGGTFTSVTNVFGGPPSAAVHVVNPNTGLTGFAGGGVPEPGTLALFGSGLFAVGTLLRRRLRS